MHYIHRFIAICYVACTYAAEFPKQYTYQGNLYGHTNSVWCLTTIPSAFHQIISGALDMSLKQWDLGIGVCVRNFQQDEKHRDKVLSLTSMPTNPVVIAGLSNGYVNIYDIRQKQLVTKYRGHSGAINTIASADPCFFTGSADGTVNMCDIKKPLKPDLFFVAKKGIESNCSIFSVVFDGNNLVIGAKSSPLLSIDIKSKKVKKSTISCCISRIIIDPKTKNIITGLRNGEIFVWDHDTMQVTRAVMISNSDLRCIAMGKNNDEFIVGSFDHTVKIIPTISPSCCTQIIQGDEPINDVLYTNECIAFTDGDNIQLWR